MNETGCVYLVGAGCRDADLITVRGLKLLQQCQVLVYDDLIPEGLLKEASQDAEKIYVGKRCKAHSMPQEEICRLLIKKAREGKLVIRLKGGDPFVFGRGGEEMLALKEAGIPCEEVPGVTSAIAMPAAAGIPVTHRGVSQSLHIITAHTADTKDGLPTFMDRLAALPGTLVFLMGLGQLEKIVQSLLEGGMERNTPAAVVSGAGSFCVTAVRGTLETIVPETERKQVKPPAVIVVGNAAAMELTGTIK